MGEGVGVCQTTVRKVSLDIQLDIRNMAAHLRKDKEERNTVVAIVNISR